MPALWFERALLPEGWAHDVRIEIADGLVASVTPDAVPGDAERHRLGLPGLPNLHSHTFQRGMAGLTERRGETADSFWTWRETMYRFVDRIGPEEVEALAAQAFVEMLESGFTRVGEFHYLHHSPDGSPYGDLAELGERIAAATATAGIGLTLLPVFYRHGNFGEVPASHGQRRFLNDPGRFALLYEASARALSDLPDAVLGVAPHSLRAATPDEIRWLAALTDGPVHIHAAEQTREVEDCLAATGARPIELLLDRVGIDGRWCVVHATHMNEAETAGLARSGAVAGLCPITESSLGDGIFPADRYMAAGGRFGIGSDSNVLIDAAEELRSLEYSQRLALRGRAVLAGAAGASTGRSLFDGALAGGARALGVPAGLAVGRPADLVSLDLDHPSLAGRSDDRVLDSWIFAGSRRMVDRVWRRGDLAVSGGRHRARDEVAARYRAALDRILS